MKEIKKKLYKRIDTYTVLSESDKKARKRQISSILFYGVLFPPISLYLNTTKIIRLIFS